MIKKMKQLRNEIEEYLAMIEDVFIVFKKCIEVYIEKGMKDEEFNKDGIIHELEEKADEKRRSIIKYITQAKFLTETKTDFLKMVNHIDKIANKSERVIDDIIVVNFDKQLDSNIILSILSITETQFNKLKRAFKMIFKDFDQAFELAHSLETEEEMVDTLKKTFISALIDKDISLSEKIYYRKFISDISDISDIIEDIGDEIERISSVRGL